MLLSAARINKKKKKKKKKVEKRANGSRALDDEMTKMKAT
jgi:hypothetical protein